MTGFVDGNCISLLTNGSEYFPALEAALDAAKHEIHLETYIFEDDAAGRRIAAALQRAARRGVATHLLVDGYGSKKQNPGLVKELQSAGVRYLVYRPDIAPWTFQRQRLRRMHRKLAVIDARIAFVGGINIIDDMHTPRQTPPRFDYAVRIQGPLLGDIHPVVKKLWARVAFTQMGQEWHAGVPLVAADAAVGRQRAAFLIRDNFRHRSDIEDAYLAAIAGARREILIASSYFFPGQAFRRALMDAAARGVRVVLLLQGRVEYVLLRYAASALYGAFLESGIEIHEYYKSFLHAKVAVIDRRWATVGSSNIDPLSLLLAREANVIIDDREFAGSLRQSLDAAMMTGASQVMRENWKARSLPTRVAMWLGYGLARILIGISGYGRARGVD